MKLLTIESKYLKQPEGILRKFIVAGDDSDKIYSRILSPLARILSPLALLFEACHLYIFCTSNPSTLRSLYPALLWRKQVRKSQNYQQFYPSPIFSTLSKVRIFKENSSSLQVSIQEGETLFKTFARQNHILPNSVFNLWSLKKTCPI